MIDATQSTNTAPVVDEPIQDRDTRDPWAIVVDDVAADAHGRATVYPAEGLVPEGGE